ncbi:MAG: hypothetical protein HFE63_09915 [Clostridiales bacterium]|nr:hypothetical protein [Clostridiales bacterium]
MKKLAITLLIIAGLFTVSCGDNSTPNNTKDNDTNDTVELEVTDNTTGSDETTDTEKVPETAKTSTSTTYECKLDNGNTIVIGTKAEDTIKSLGEPLDFMEAPSCVHPGSDKVYTFDGFTVSTSPDAAGVEYITELSLLSDVVALESGIMIGSSADDVTAALGSDFTEKFGVRTYLIDDITISITFTDDYITAFSISKPMQ